MPTFTANPTSPRRYRSPIAIGVDVTVTPGPSAFNPSPQRGQIFGGELVYLTPAGGAASLLTAGTNNANAAQCIGIANDAYPRLLAPGIYDAPIPNDPLYGVPMITLFENGDHMMFATGGDVIQPYQPVYLGADARTVQLTALGASVGYVSPDQRGVSSLLVAAQPGAAVTTPPSFGVAVATGQPIYIRLTPALA